MEASSRAPMPKPCSRAWLVSISSSKFSSGAAVSVSAMGISCIWIGNQRAAILFPSVAIGNPKASMSIARPTSSQMTGRLIVLTIAIFGIVIAQAQMLMGWGQTQAEFAADSDEALRVAGYAFAIWGVIYLGLLVYAVRQALPRTPESEVLGRFGWPSVIAFLGIGWWIVAAAFDWEWATIALIFMAKLALLIPFVGYARLVRTTPIKSADRWTVLWPLGLLAGWLTAAAPLNVLTVLAGNGQLPDVLPLQGWAALAILLIAGVGLAVTARIRLIAYPIPIAWGLLGAFVAEQARDRPVAWLALAASLVVLGGGAWLVFRLRPGIERAI